MSSEDWRDKSFLVVGASSAIGVDVCRQILQAGGKVLATARNTKNLAELQDVFPNSFKKISLDLMDSTSCQNIAKEIVEKISGFVYCAGTLTIAPIKFYKHDDFSRVMRVNCEAFLEICQTLMRKSLLTKGSSIVAVSSIAENHAIPGNAIYAASKAALSAACRVLALELAREKIRVNTVSPGALDSGMTKQVESELSAEIAAKHASAYPLGPGSAQDVANLIIFMLSGGSRWITGTSSLIDGGICCR